MVTISSVMKSGNMEIQRVIWQLLVVRHFVVGADEPSYFLVGGKLVLRPPTSENITQILWTHNDDKFAEWNIGDSLPSYGSFEGRTTLDTNTGQLEMTDMSEAGSGVYSVEINWTVQDQRYVAMAIEETPRPVIWVRPVSCSSAMDRCTLICDGMTTGVEPVDYSWRMGDGEWRQATRELNITKTETANISTFSCRMKNPVSEKESEPKYNPFIQGSGASVVAGLVFLAVVVLLVVVGLSVAYWKRDKIKGCLPRSKSCTHAEYRPANVE